MRHRPVQWATIASDLALINLAFALSYVARYRWQWLRPVAFSEPYSDYLGQQAVLTILLAITFACVIASQYLSNRGRKPA